MLHQNLDINRDGVGYDSLTFEELAVMLKYANYNLNATSTSNAKHNNIQELDIVLACPCYVDDL